MPSSAMSSSARPSSARPVLTPEMARQQARKARRLAFEMLSRADCDRLLAYAREMDEHVDRLEADPALTLLSDSP